MGKISDVAEKLGAISGVLEVDTTTGPYDIISVVSAPDLNAVGDVVTLEIHSISGIVRTVSCLVVGATK